LGLARQGQARRGGAGIGWIWRGAVRQGKARFSTFFSPQRARRSQMGNMKPQNDIKIRDLTWIQKFVKALQSKDFYGELHLDFYKGEIKNYKQTKSGKPD
jgi:hypothetical protein